jgi:hypothetical protein
MIHTLRNLFKRKPKHIHPYAAGLDKLEEDETLRQIREAEAHRVEIENRREGLEEGFGA